jgi:hypothetical protein
LVLNIRVCNNTPCLEPPKVWCHRLQSVRSIAKSDTAMSVPEESDSRNASFKFRWSWLHLLDSLVYFFPTTYIIWLSNLLTLSWKWFQKCVVCTKLYIIYVFIQSRGTHLHNILPGLWIGFIVHIFLDPGFPHVIKVSMTNIYN